MSEILDKIRKDYIEFSKRNKYIQDLIAKFENGKASLSEIDSITKATGYALKVAITKNVSENAAAFADEDTLLEILDGTFHDNYELINEVAASVQKNLDKKQGINIKPQKADFPQDRIENLAKFTAGKDLSEEKALSEFGASIENINNSIYTDYVQTNAKFRYEAGLRVYVIRTDGAGCCEWCSNLVGKYEEPNIPKDVWRRHKRCSCEITYVNEKTGARDRITYSDSKNGKKIESQKHVTKLTPEQAFAKEKEVLSRIDKSGKSGIINEKSKKPITKITDKAIENVPKVKIDGYTDEQCDLIQQQHKELLKYSRDNNDGKEVAFVMDNSISSRKEFFGSDDKLDFGSELYGKDLLVMHNHPRNSSYSITDLIFFRNSTNVKTLTIVKNSGNVEFITKTSEFNGDKYKLEYDRLYKKIVLTGTESEKDKFVRTFLRKTKSGVIWNGR